MKAILASLRRGVSRLTTSGIAPLVLVLALSGGCASYHVPSNDAAYTAEGFDGVTVLAGGGTETEAEPLTEHAL